MFVLLKKGQKSGRKGVCEMSGFLSRRLTDQKERKVSRACSYWVFVVAVKLPTIVGGGVGGGWLLLLHL